MAPAGIVNSGTVLVPTVVDYMFENVSDRAHRDHHMGMSHFITNVGRVEKIGLGPRFAK